MNYKYYLDKSSKKFPCPKCQKKSFVKYVETETKQYLEDHVGRCDRESKCAYHFSPKGNTPVTGLIVDYKPEIPTFHDQDIFTELCNNYMNNNLVKFLLTVFDPVDVKEVIFKFRIGTSNHWKGATVFLQMDRDLDIHAGKVMLYDEKTGKRVKKPFNCITWLHRVLRIKDFVLQQCLFGLHNITECGIKTIGIVESEKTVLFMSIYRRDIIWMATGSKANFKEKLIEPLKGRKIIAFPDKGEYEDWNKKAEQLRKDGFDIMCSKLLEEYGLEEGDDLVDYIVNQQAA
ncbi:DUF6371 domain-containing protein [Xanthomarina sp. F2636L]|uniref:DUF6371 domain-containing protein n=1 Tax=Xanthomarina sp. F2636L TaxID=2996018 RepID=UPI00225E37B4|nr:DUF6371 domain-containing protein [Xanthomarina sp. F2636L]MCX7552116.1 DUF6371 domain-containing protein [Xanthomarina sp. F2636L]